MSAVARGGVAVRSARLVMSRSAMRDGKTARARDTRRPRTNTDRSVDFRDHFVKEKAKRRADVDLSTIIRPDARLAKRITKIPSKNSFGQPNGRASVTVSQAAA